MTFTNNHIYLTGFSNSKNRCETDMKKAAILQSRIGSTLKNGGQFMN